MDKISEFQWSGDDTIGDAIVHNGQVRGQYLLTAYYEAGFRVFDVSNPYHVLEVGKYDTWLDHGGSKVKGEYDGAWNLYSFLPSGNVLISDTESGLFIAKLNPRSVPAPPESLSAVGSTSTSVQLTWTGDEYDSGYTVKRSTGSSGGPFDTILATNLVDMSYTDDSVANWKAYHYVVVATNAGGESENLNEVSMEEPAAERPHPPRLQSVSIMRAPLLFTKTWNEIAPGSEIE